MTATLGPPALDLAAATTWIEILHGDAPGGLIHISSTGEWTGRTFPINQVADATDYIAHLDRQGRAGIYLRATTLRAALPDGSRGGDADTLTLPGLWADVDILGPGHKEKDLPPDEAGARAIIATSGLPEPTLWIHSGGGLYPWWLLDKPHIIDGDLKDIQTLSRRWQEVIAASAKRLGWRYGPVGDLARILRVPGTVNRKPALLAPQPCRLLDEPVGAFYTLDELRDALIPVVPDQPDASRRNGGTTPRGNDLRPGDDFEARVDWADILQPHGWRYLREAGRTRYWQRPDKDGRECSATTGRDPGRDRLWVFSTSTEFEALTPITKFAAYTLLEHGGNYRAATLELVRRGYGTPRRPTAPKSLPSSGDAVKPDEEDEERAALWNATTEEDAQRATPRAETLPVFEPRTAPREAILRGLFPSAAAAADHWDDPDPMGGTGDPPQPLPIDVLPGVLAEYVLELAASTQTPTDMAVMQVLAALSVVAANRYWISGGGGWIEPLVLWTLTALPPASRKSAVVGDVTRPLYAIERELREAHRKEHHGKDDLLAVAEQRRKQIMAEMARAKTMIGRKKLEHDLSNVKAEIEKYTVGPAKQLLADDVTPEALGMILQDNDGHVGMMSAEGGVFGAITGRYTQGSPQLDLILKAYDGDPYRANRVGRGPISIDHPAVVLGLAVQPHVLAETAKTPALRERGLMGRFAYAVPQDTVGERSNDAPEMSETARAGWHHILAGIARMTACGPEQPRRVLPLHRDALELHRDFRGTLEPRLHGHTGDLAFLSDWAGKLAGRILRIAGLLHIAEGRTNADQVSFPTMVAAVELGEAMLTHAVHVYGGWRTPEVNAGAVRVLDWVRRAFAGQPEGGETPMFTVRDAHQALRGQEWCKTSDAARDALIVLVRAGWLTTVERFMADGKRRAPAGFVPHPKALEGRTR